MAIATETTGIDIITLQPRIVSIFFFLSQHSLSGNAVSASLIDHMLNFPKTAFTVSARHTLVVGKKAGKHIEGPYRTWLASQHPRRSGSVSHSAGMAAIDADAKSTEPAVVQEALIQYVVLRKDLWTDLNWPLGSVVAQACHAATAALWLSRNEAETQRYCAPGALEHMHKVEMFTDWFVAARGSCCLGERRVN